MSTTIGASGGFSSAYQVREPKSSEPDAAPAAPKPFPVDVSKVRQLKATEKGPFPSLRVSPANLEMLAAQPEQADNSVSKIWGNVEVRGKVVAQIYDTGLTVTKSGFDLPRAGVESDDPAVRAQALISAYGGNLVLRSEMKNPTLFHG